MKLITAIIQPNKLGIVREALIREDITRITVSRCTGHGRAEEIDIYRGQEVEPPLISKVRIDIACNDKYAKTAIKTILKTAKHTDGKVGDGKIFVTNLEECYRIRTDEEGEGAV
jgi:nitrogen regulatory protein P-II 1